MSCFIDMGILLYPYFLVIFWYKDFLSGSIRTCFAIFSYTASLLSFTLLLKTFFQPLKNEYREGLVWFSIIMGMLIKSVILVVTSVILLILAIILISICVGIMFLPLILVWFLFTK